MKLPNPQTWLAVFPWLVACSSGGTGRPVHLADGGYSLSCRGPLADCLRHAERLCRDQGYAVTEARDVREILGHEQGQSRVLIERSDATIYCGDAKPREAIRLSRETAPPTTATTTPSAPTPSAAPPPRACVPGVTQACVGPGGCTGGQACADDGTRFEPCNCGAAAPGSSPTTP